MIDDLRRAHDVAADDRDAVLAARTPAAPRTARPRPARRVCGGSASVTSAYCGAPPIARDVADVHGQRLPAEVRPRRAPGRKCTPSTSVSVVASTTASPDAPDGRVVADADDERSAGRRAPTAFASRSISPNSPRSESFTRRLYGSAGPCGILSAYAHRHRLRRPRQPRRAGGRPPPRRRAGGPIDAVWCLGDTVGYGPQPRSASPACASWARRWSPATTTAPPRGDGHRGVQPGRGRRPRSGRADQLAEDAAAYLDSLPEVDRTSPPGASSLWSTARCAGPSGSTSTPTRRRRPTWSSRRRRSPWSATRTCRCWSPRARSSSTAARCTACEDGESVPLPDDRKIVLNPGSVGQPRDGDPRAAYAIYERTRGRSPSTAWSTTSRRRRS